VNLCAAEVRKKKKEAKKKKNLQLEDMKWNLTRRWRADLISTSDEEDGLNKLCVDDDDDSDGEDGGGEEGKRIDWVALAHDEEDAEGGQSSPVPPRRRQLPLLSR
jgi:hypothetical protein